MFCKPTWHTVMNENYFNEAIVSAPTWKVHVRPLVNGGYAYLVRVVVREAVTYSEAKQALLDAEWTWSHSIWGDDADKDAIHEANPFAPWMRRRMKEIWQLAQEGMQYRGFEVSAIKKNW